MATGKIGTSDLPGEVGDWLDVLNDLISQAKLWTEAAGWETRSTARDVNEPGLPRYEVPILVLDRDDVEVSLVPVARQIPGGGGLVDLYLMPDFDAVASLHQQGGRWFLHYAFRSASPEPERLPLDEASLNRALNDIAAHAQAL